MENSMGLFARLFGRSAQNDRSYVRSWAEKQDRELRYSNDLSIEKLFVLVMYGLSSFGKKNEKKTKYPFKIKGIIERYYGRKIQKIMGLDASEHYSGDATLFELGCYMYFLLDLWLYQHKPHHRDNISRTLANEFTKLFTQALDSKDIPTLFDQRISQYAKLSRTIGIADFNKYHHHLSQLIFRAKDNQLPKSYDFEFENEPLMWIGANEAMGVEIALGEWVKSMLPALIETLEKYCDLTE